MGETAGRELIRFQNQLRVDFLREDWAAMMATVDPNFADPLEQTAAVDTLRQFRGLVALKGPNRKPLTQDAMRADLESHFQKLLGYGNPRVFFHLTYAYVEDQAALMRFLEMSAETARPPGFNFLGIETIPHDNSRPPGFVARYSAEFGEVKVVFLVLNLGQQQQALAAKTAGATKVRKAPKAKKTHRN